MILPDVNVLVNAFRSESPDHQRCRNWLLQVVEGRSRYAISTQVLSSVMRVVTHPRVFEEPSELSEAQEFCAAILTPDHCVVVAPGRAHWQIFASLCTATEARGNLIPDAWFAALAIETGCEWITLDRDYRRFPGLKWSQPS